MARPREFEEETVLDAAMRCFWDRGYQATSVRDLVNKTGITGASLYNAFGDKRALYRKALDRYVDRSIADRLQRCAKLAPREAIGAFLAEILKRSLGDREHKGCLLVNAAVEVAPHDPEFQEEIADVLVRIERFFLKCVEAGQTDGTISRSLPAEQLARHLLGVLVGIRVLARVRPERALVEGIASAALSLLEPSD
jgi:TetR/AcrR family transcriptional regulator, transcriptional repressor for nem operon